MAKKKEKVADPNKLKKLEINRNIEKPVLTIDEKFAIVVIIGFFLLLINIMVLLSNSVADNKRVLDYEIMYENIALQDNLSVLNSKYRFLQQELIDCNMEKDIILNTMDIAKENLNEINCLVNEYIWDSEKNMFIESDYFVSPPKCFEVLE